MVTRRGIVVVGKFIVKLVKRRLESGWVFVKETSAKFADYGRATLTLV